MAKNKLLQINGNTKIAGVTGNPITHSKSPKIHNFWLSENQIDGLYIPIPIAQDEDFNHVVRSMCKIGIMGMNVTSPYKILAHDICDELTDCAKAIGSVNTLTFQANGKIHGDCTDAYGFYQALLDRDPNFTITDKTALVIGAGGASRAIIWQLIHEGAGKIIIANRTISKAEDIVKSFNIAHRCDVISINHMEDYLQDIHLLVNTTTLGATAENDLHINLQNLNSEAIVYDILYNPAETTLLKQAKERGNVCLNGEGMLLHQAVPAFERWFEIKPVVNFKLYEYIYGETYKLKVIGLTGTIGSGKSTVSKILISNGYPVFDADSNVHKLMKRRKMVMQEIVENFGEEILTNNYIDRQKLGAIVLNSSEKLRLLESILYPYLIEKIEKFILAQEKRGLCFLDVPLLFEKNFDRFCDSVLVISIESHIQQQRVLKRQHMTQEKLDQFLSEQMPIEEKVKKADHVIHNDGNPADLKANVLNFVDKQLQILKSGVK